MLLSNFLDTVTEAFKTPDFLEAMDEADHYAELWASRAVIQNELDNAQLPDLSDLHTLYIQDNTITRDTDILVECYDDIEDKYLVGIITAWERGMYLGEDFERAFVIAEDNSTTATPRYQHINPICEVEKFNEITMADPLSALLPTVALSNESNTGAIQSIRDLYELPQADSVPTEIGA